MNSQVGVGTTLTDRPTARPDGPGHVLCAEEFRSSGTVALPGVPCRIYKGRDRDSRNILVRRWCVAAITVHPGKDAEMRGQPNRHKVGVSEEARVYDRVRDSGRHGEQPVDEPMLAGHQRGMRGACQPLGDSDDVL